MLDKLQDFIIAKTNNHDLAYYITCIVYLILTFGGLGIIGYIYGLWWQILLLGILMSIIRFFSMGYHCNSNIHCFIISSIVLIIFGTLSNIMPLWVVFILCLCSCRDIYQKSPIELNDDFEGKDEDWHFKRVVLIMVIYLIISLITYYFGLYKLCKCFMLSLIMVDLLLFKNNKNYI